MVNFSSYKTVPRVDVVSKLGCSTVIVLLSKKLPVGVGTPSEKVVVSLDVTAVPLMVITRANSTTAAVPTTWKGRGMVDEDTAPN